MMESTAGNRRRLSSSATEANSVQGSCSTSAASQPWVLSFRMAPRSSAERKRGAQLGPQLNGLERPSLEDNHSLLPARVPHEPAPVSLSRSASSTRTSGPCSLPYTCHVHGAKRICMSIGTVFFDNGSQAVCLPLDVRLPEGVHKVDVRVKGNERILTPLGQTWDSFFSDGRLVSDDFLSKRAEQDREEREAL